MMKRDHGAAFGRWRGSLDLRYASTIRYLFTELGLLR